MVETVTEIVRVCPAELTTPEPARPTPAGVVKHDEAGGAFLDALAGWGEQLAALLTGARTACQAQGAR